MRPEFGNELKPAGLIKTTEVIDVESLLQKQGSGLAKTRRGGIRLRASGAEYAAEGHPA